LNSVFKDDMMTHFSAIAQAVTFAPPKSFQRMLNKLMSPTEHGDPTIAKPRPMKNLDVLRFAMSFTTCEKVEMAMKVLKENYRILRVKNNYPPDSEGGFGGYRQILVNFAYTADITYRELFGYSGSSDIIVGRAGNKLAEDDDSAHKWYRFMRTLGPSLEAQWWLEPLWRLGRLEPDTKVVMAAEVQLIFYPYHRGRHFSHLLYKIARSVTGPSEMVRDFATRSFRSPTQEELDALESVTEIAEQIRKKRGRRAWPKELLVMQTMYLSAKHLQGFDGE